MGGVLAEVNDILELQDLISIAESFSTSSLFFPILSNGKNKKRFWINRTSNAMRNNITTSQSIRKCWETPRLIDQNCIALRREAIRIDGVFTYDQCLTESDECSSTSAIPVCTDKHLEISSNVIPPTTNSPSSVVSVNVLTDYSCGEDPEYHFMKDYCYKIFHHETTWQNANAECKRDHAMLFLPDQSTKLELIQFLLARQSSYTSSGMAHVGISYNNQNRTATRRNTIDTDTFNSLSNLSDLCATTFRQRYRSFILLSGLSLREKNRFKTRQISCAYFNFRSTYAPSILCDEISCDQLATVICQKSPILKRRALKAKR